MDRVAVAAEGADRQASPIDRLLESLQLAVALQQFCRFAVCIAGIGARADLDRLESKLLDVVERFLEGLAAEQDCKDADFHVCLTAELKFGPTSIQLPATSLPPSASTPRLSPWRRAPSGSARRPRSWASAPCSSRRPRAGRTPC